MQVRQVLQEAQETTYKAETPVAVPVETTGTAALRVTPRELTEAVSALDAARMREANYKAETIALGEAVEQLNLNVTPEELLAQIERNRAATKEAETKEVATKEAEAVTQTSLSKMMFGVKRTTQATQQRRTLLRSPVLARLKVAGIAASVLANVIFTAYHLTAVFTAGRTAYYSRDGIHQMLYGDKDGQVENSFFRPELDFSSRSKHWVVSEDKGQRFVHGYTSGNVDAALTDFTPVKTNENQLPVKLPIERLRDVKGIANVIGVMTDLGEEPVDAEPVTMSDGEGGFRTGRVERLNIPAPGAKANPIASDKNGLGDL